MNKRNDLLSRAWTGAQLEIGGKPIILSAVRYAILEYWHNRLFDETNEDQNPIAAMGELIMICSASREDFKAIQRLTAEERAAKVMDFIVEHEDQIDDVSAGVQDRLEAIKAAMVESESPGKGVQAHVS